MGAPARAFPRSDLSMKLHWLFFDLDGTLADSLPGLRSSITEALESQGRTLRVDDLKPYIGPGIRTILRNLEDGLTEADLDEMERCFRASYDTKGVTNTQLFDGVAHTLEVLKQNGSELFLVTNKPKLATATLMDQHGVAPMFTEMLSRNSRDPAFTSKTEMLKTLVERHEVELEGALMVGDTAEDHEAAMAVGMRFIFADYGYGSMHPAEDCVRVAGFKELLHHCSLAETDRAGVFAADDVLR